MRLHQVLPLLLMMRGGVSIQIITRIGTFICIQNISTEGTGFDSGELNKKCAPFAPSEHHTAGQMTAVDFDYTKGLIYYTVRNDDKSDLTGFTFNFAVIFDPYSEKITQVDPTLFAVDWVHHTFYTTTFEKNIVMSSTVSKLFKSVSSVVRQETIKRELGVDSDLFSIRDLKVDPYEGFLFVLVMFRPDGITLQSAILRTNLDGNGLKILPNTEYNTTGECYFCIDVGETKLYVSKDNELYQCNYKGRLLKMFHSPIRATHIAVLGNTLFATTSTTNLFYEGFMNHNQSHIDIRKFTILNIKLYERGLLYFKLLDARAQRRKRHGKYICDRTDCLDLCEVLPTGDTCLCEKNKAKSRDVAVCYTCGQSNLTSSLVLEPTIVDGSDSQLGNFPWYATLYYSMNKTQFCGGTLVSSRTVLTAAHCVTFECDNCRAPLKPANEITVILGKTQRAWNVTEPLQITRQITEIHVHGDYVGPSNNYVHDIALLLLESNVPVSNFVMPACLDYFNLLPSYETLDGYVAGFGYTEECGSSCSTHSETLKYTKLRVLSFSNCYNISNSIQRTTNYRLSTDKFCSGNGSVSVAQEGDSGGGLTLVYNGLSYVTGVVSVKFKDWHEKGYSFGAYTDVSKHMDWIKRTLPVV